MNRLIACYGVMTLLAAGLVLMAPAPADAFCIYNKTDKELGVIQESGNKTFHGFQANISPGGKACCNWQNDECNKEGKKDSILTFGVPKWYEDDDYYCRGVRVKAGGWMTITGSGDDIRCTAHD